MDLKECLSRICDWYHVDTVEFLDFVLTDDLDDPQYSAITAINRLWIYLQYKKATDGNFEHNQVSTMLLSMGYTNDDIALLKNMAQKERNIYIGDILDTEFF